MVIFPPKINGFNFFLPLKTIYLIKACEAQLIIIVTYGELFEGYSTVHACIYFLFIYLKNV